MLLEHGMHQWCIEILHIHHTNAVVALTRCKIYELLFVVLNHIAQNCALRNNTGAIAASILFRC